MAKKQAKRRRGHLHVYRAKDGIRWRARAANGRIVADSGEAYTTLVALKRGLVALRRIVGPDLPTVLRIDADVKR